MESQQKKKPKNFNKIYSPSAEPAEPEAAEIRIKKQDGDQRRIIQEY
jgi:hypothetical protein